MDTANGLSPASDANSWPQDIRFQVAMEERHEKPCGPAVKKLCEPAYEVFGDKKYAIHSTISVSHLYNLRKSTTFCQRRRHFEKTKAKPSSNGERCKPESNGQPGHIRKADNVLYLFLSRKQVDAKGKQRKKYTYENMITPFDKLGTLPLLKVI